MGKPYVGIIFFRSGCREEQESGLWSAVYLRQAHQFLANATFLMRYADGQIGKVSDVMKIRERTRNSHHQFIIPGSNGEVGILEHPSKSFWVIDGATFTQSGSTI